MKNIYVGNLPFTATEQDLRSLFEAYGQVDNVSVAKDKFTGQPRGFGFVEMADDGQGERAIAELNGSMIGDRNLTVNEARPREARPRPSGGFGARDRGGRGDRDRGGRGGRGGGGRR